MTVKILITSKNPIKILAAQHAFSCFYDNVSVVCLDIEDTLELNSQPVSERETYECSVRRVEYTRLNHPFKTDIDYYVGIEGGIALTLQGNPRIIVYSTIGDHSVTNTVKGCEIPLPSQWYNELENNSQLELGDLVTRVSGVSNIKQKEGAVGFLTNGIVKRYDILKQSVIMALIPFLHPTLYEKSLT